MESKEWTQREMQIISHCDLNYRHVLLKNTNGYRNHFFEFIVAALKNNNFHRTVDEIKYFFAVIVPDLEEQARLKAMQQEAPSSIRTRPLTPENKTDIKNGPPQEKSILNEKCIEISKQNNKLQEIKQEHTKKEVCTGITDDNLDRDNDLDFEPDTSDEKQSNNSEFVELSAVNNTKINRVKSSGKECKPLCKDTKVLRKGESNNVKASNHNCNSSPSDKLAQSKNIMNAVVCLPKKCDETELIAKANNNNGVLNNKPSSGNTSKHNEIQNLNKEYIAKEHKKAVTKIDDKQPDGSNVFVANSEQDNIEVCRTKQKDVTELCPIQPPVNEESKNQKQSKTPRNRQFISETRREYMRIRNRAFQKFRRRKKRLMQNDNRPVNVSGKQLQKSNNIMVKQENYYKPQPAQPMKRNYVCTCNQWNFCPSCYQNGKGHDMQYSQTSGIELNRSGFQPMDHNRGRYDMHGYNRPEFGNCYTAPHDDAMETETGPIPEENGNSTNDQIDHPTSSYPYKDYYLSDGPYSKVVQETGNGESNSSGSVEATSTGMSLELVSQSTAYCKDKNVQKIVDSPEVTNSEATCVPSEFGCSASILQQVPLFKDFTSLSPLRCDSTGPDLIKHEVTCVPSTSGVIASSVKQESLSIDIVADNIVDSCWNPSPMPSSSCGLSTFSPQNGELVSLDRAPNVGSSSSLCPVNEKKKKIPILVGYRRPITKNRVRRCQRCCVNMRKLMAMVEKILQRQSIQINKDIAKRKRKESWS